MVFRSAAGRVVVNSVRVVNKGLRVGDGAADGATLVDLVHHGLLASDETVLLDLVDVVLFRDVAGLAGVTVAAHGHGRAADTVGPAASLVNRARLVRDVIIVDPLKRVVGEATEAAEVHLLAADQHLRGEVDVGPGGVTHDLDSV